MWLAVILVRVLRLKNDASEVVEKPPHFFTCTNMKTSTAVMVHYEN